MTWVKVCGLRRPVDVAAAVEAGADAIGLVLAPSPRRVTPAEAADLAKGVPAACFVVTVDEPPRRVLALAERVGADGVQAHGRHAAAAAAAARAAGLEVLRPVAVNGRVDLSGIPDDQLPLLDAHHPEMAGGTGRRFDASAVGAIERRWVMAGGLDPDNVADLVARLRPWGVDASSRLESEPGVKDPALIEAFVAAARSA